MLYMAGHEVPKISRPILLQVVVIPRTVRVMLCGVTDVVEATKTNARDFFDQS